MSTSRLPHQLSFTKLGYEPFTIDVDWNNTTQQFEVLDEPLAAKRDMILVGQPGSIEGTVQLTEFSSLERVQAIDILLLDEENNLINSVNPTAEGQFLFDDVPSGQYTLSINANGYENITQQLSVCGKIQRPYLPSIWFTNRALLPLKSSLVILL